MHSLAAQVTSSLLPFPRVTVEALREDEITINSVLHGRFTVGRSGLVWLACGPQLEVAHGMTGERLSAYCFSGVAEHSPSILSARDFSWLKRFGLLVGLEEAEGSVLCLYDLGLSRVVKAVVIPGRITAIEPLVSYGGASTSTQHLHQSLRWFFGIAAITTDLGHVLLVDLCLDDLSCSQSELEASDLQVVTKSPGEIPRLRELSTRQGRHLCLQLSGASGVGATAAQFISRTNHLAVGFSDGNLQLWNMKTLKKEYHSQLEGGRVPVHAFTFQEPENDPRNCCYLWAVQSAQDLEGDVVTLRLLQLAFSERKCLASGKILYEGLEYCEERFSQDLTGSAPPLRTQTTNTRLLSCQTIEKFRPHLDRDDSMNEVASPDTSVSIFSWQVKPYGQGTPTTYIGVFDINRWYHAQMPDSLRTGESLLNCPYLAVWSLDRVVQMVSSQALLDVVVHDRSLSRGLPFTCPPPEQYFNPTTYNFDASCLLKSGIVHLTCSGYQKETLSFLKKAALCSSDVISSTYTRCLMSGLLSSRLADTQASSLSQEEQLDAILSTAVETSSLELITGCIKQWTAEEQPGSALNLRYILDWAWNKVVQTKEELDGICAPLFDSSSNFTDPQTLQLLQHSQRLLTNLSTIFHCLLSEAQELTQKGLLGLMNKNMVSSLISKYAQVVLWFCRTGLLPEGSDDDALQISRPYYSQPAISNYYTIRREELTRLAKGNWCSDCLMIDGLVGQCGEHLTNLWKRDEGGTGQYPPPTLHALLDVYLLDNIDEATKHAIVIYLLLDVMYSFPTKEGASVESFPIAFAIPIGLVKLVQGLWLLDHNDHQSSFELLLHPAASQCQFEWQHERVLHALMCQGQHSVALRYFHAMKPPVSSTSQAKLCLSVLLHNRCIFEAWALIRQHSMRLNMGELLGFLYESCQELNLIKELLRLPLSLSEQECFEKFLQGTGGLQNRELLMVHYLQRANYIPALQLNHSLRINQVNERGPKLKERSNIRNSILDQYGKVLPRVQRKLAMERAKPYQHPPSIHRQVSRPQPLSTISKRSANEKVMSRAGFINSVLNKIEEVWLGQGATPQSSPSRSSSRATGLQSPKPSWALSEPFLGTPITISSKRKSRLMDLVVQPSCQTSLRLLSPPRPPSSWVSPKSLSKAPELSLLQTPQVVKRARALAASEPVFSAFTPQSILRSSLRPTPVATPSASPGRSITPPLRNKESQITFIEEAESCEPEKVVQWTNGMAADSEISLLARSSTPSKDTHKTWSSYPAEEEEAEEEGEEELARPVVKFASSESGVPSPEPRSSKITPETSQKVSAQDRLSEVAPTKLTLSFDASQTSVRSTDTTLEFFDAPLSIDGQEAASQTDDAVVTVNIQPPAEQELAEERPAPSAEQHPLQKIEDVVREEEEANEEQIMQEAKEAFMKEGAEDEEEVQSEEVKQQDAEVGSTPQGTAALEQADLFSYSRGDGIGVELQHEAVPALQQNVQSEPTEAEYQTEEEAEQSADLTEFVEKHLFADLSPPLTRSGIHSASQAQTPFDSLPPGEVEVEKQPPAGVPPTLSSQKSTTSVTSSEPAGTDSHSVVSLKDSEELSSSVSEEEEEEEESEDAEEEEQEEEEEEEDSDSEVEIIKEVQGNGRLPPLQPTPVFVHQADNHFLPSLSEQDGAGLSLMPPVAELVEEDMEGDVVMVRLGDDDGVMAADVAMAQGSSSYMELKPSTTLLVPLELMEGQDGLVDTSQLDLHELHQAESETHSSFSLMLDVDEEGVKDADSAPVKNDVLLTDSPARPSAEVVFFGTDDPHVPLCTGVEEEEETEEQKDELDLFDGVCREELPVSEVKTNLEVVDTYEHVDANLARFQEDQEAAALLVSEISPADEAAEGDEAAAAAEGDEAAAEAAAEGDEAASEAAAEGDEAAAEAAAEGDEAAAEAAAEGDEAAAEAAAKGDEVATEAAAEGGEAATEAGGEAAAEAGGEAATEAGGEAATEAGGEAAAEAGGEAAAEAGGEAAAEAGGEAAAEAGGEAAAETGDEAAEARGEAAEAEGEAAADEAAALVMVVEDSIALLHGTLVNEDKITIDNQAAAEPDQVDDPAVHTDTVSHSTEAETVSEETQQHGEGAQDKAIGRKAAAGGEEEELKSVNVAVELCESDGLKEEDPVAEREKEGPSTRRTTRGRTVTFSAPEEPSVDEAEAGPLTRAASPSRASKKRNAAQPSTPRRSSRRAQQEPPKEVQKEEEHVEMPQEAPPASPSRRRGRKPKAEAESDDLDEAKKAKVSSPSRITRRSSRQITRTTREDAVSAEAAPVLELSSKPSSTRAHHRTTRSKLWDPPEEDLPLLDSPLEVDSETPVADALIKRLQDEEKEGGLVTTKMARGSRRNTKASAKEAKSLQPVEDGSAAGNPSPTENSFIYSPSRRRTRARRAESPGPSEEPSAPLTRSRRVTMDATANAAPHDEMTSEEDREEKAASVATTRKTSKRTAKSRAAPELPPVAEVELISPLPSPAEPPLRAQKRMTEGEAPTSSRNLRRKRIMEAVFTKPVTRRKKL